MCGCRSIIKINFSTKFLGAPDFVFMSSICIIKWFRRIFKITAESDKYFHKSVEFLIASGPIPLNIDFGTTTFLMPFVFLTFFFFFLFFYCCFLFLSCDIEIFYLWEMYVMFPTARGQIIWNYIERNFFCRNGIIIKSGLFK